MFPGGCLVAAVTLLALGLGGRTGQGEGHRGGPVPAPTAPAGRSALAAPVVVGGGRPTRRAGRAGRDPGEDHDLGRQAARAVRRTRDARRVGRRFMAGLLALDAVELNEARARLVASATPELARSLLAGHPRVPTATPSAPQGRLGALEPLATSARDRIELAAAVRRAGVTSGLVLSLKRRDGRWRVSQIH
jgi:hypothetical protein